MALRIEDLRSEIAAQRVVAIVGTGVSVGASRDLRASWKGLLQNGIDRCASFGHPMPSAGWAEQQRDALERGNLNDWLRIAQDIENRLRDAGEYRRWLRDTVGALPLQNATVLEALHDLDIPVATLNYDDLIEKVTGLRPVTWRDGAAVERALRKEEPRVLHLHGHWEDPDSVVLGIQSYGAVLGDAHAQTVQKALAMFSSFMFIGCGGTFDDPNLSALRSWMRTEMHGSEHRHYRLCLTKDLAELEKARQAYDRLFPLSYGDEHNQLASFLRSLKPPGAGTVPADAGTGHLPPNPRSFGRDALIEELIQTLLLAISPATPILGPPGVGKSNLALRALHDQRVTAKYGSRRYFIRLDGAASADSMAVEIAVALGLPPSKHPLKSAIAALSMAPAILALDNVETPWETDLSATEEALATLATVPGLALVATLRGAQRPGQVQWRDPISLTVLGPPDDRSLFLAIAGARHENDTRLTDLLAAVEGLPLAIELLAYQAEAEPDLSMLWQLWQSKRTKILQRGAADTPLLNLKVSFEISINSRRMTGGGRRLLSLLGLLPDGIAHNQLESLMPGESYAAAMTLRRVALAFDEAQRLRTWATLREYVAAHHRTADGDLSRILEHYAALANLGQDVGKLEGGGVAATIAADAGNIRAALSRGLDQPEHMERCVTAALGFSQFQHFTGQAVDCTPRGGQAR